MISKKGGAIHAIAADLNRSAYTTGGILGGMLVGGKITQKVYDRSMRARNKKLLHRLRMKVSRGYRDQEDLDRFGVTLMGAQLGGVTGGSFGKMKDLQRASRRRSAAAVEDAQRRWQEKRDTRWESWKERRGKEGGKWEETYEKAEAKRKAEEAARKRAEERRKRYEGYEEEARKRAEERRRKYEENRKSRAGSGSSSGSYGGGRSSGFRGDYRANAKLDIHLGTVGIPKDVKKKSEAKKIYIKKVFSIHPDRNPGMDDGPLKNLNNAWDELKKTVWYEKLAFILSNKSCERLALGNISLRASLKLASDK